MFSTEEKFQYFISIEKQIHVIIKANYKEDKIKILAKISQLVDIQNKKSALILELDFDEFEETGSFTLYLKEWMKTRGIKKIFQTIISIKAIIREIRLDIILGK